MHIEVNTKALITAIKQVSKLMDKKARLACLSHITLTNSEKGLTVFATNINNDIEITIPSEYGTHTEVTLEAKPLLKILAAFPKKSTVSINANGEIADGLSTFNLKPIDSSDMPAKVATDLEIPILTIHSDDIHPLLKATKYSMSVSDVRYFLIGALIDIKGCEFNIVATDGHRLSKASIKVEPTKDASAIVPRQAITMLYDLTKGNELIWSIYITDKTITFSTDNITLSSKLIVGRYPDYERVIPSSTEHSVTINRQAFNTALMHLQAVIKDKYSGITLELKDTDMILTYITYKNTVDPDNPKRTIRVIDTTTTQTLSDDHIKRDHTSVPIKFGMNCAYLLSALNTMDSNAFIMRYSDQHSSFIFEPDLQNRFNHVIMPMRLENI